MSGVLRVLYVDDEPDIREVTVLALELDGGIKACAAGSCAEAMAILGAGEFTPDVGLLDVMMPDKDGPAVLVELRARGFRMPAIFM